MTLKPPVPGGSPIADRVDVIFDSPVNVRYPAYGARGDGITDDTASVQRALAAAQGRPVVLSGATFRFLSGLTMPSGGVTLVLDDATLDFSDAPVGSIFFSLAGALGTARNCSSVAAGATSITGTAIETGLVAGDLVKLTASDVFDPGRTSSTVGEIAEVLSTSSNTITLRTPVMGAYSTSVKVSPLTTNRMTLKGTGEILGGGVGSQHIGVKARQTLGLRVDNIRMAGVENVGFQLYDCLDFEVSNVDIDASNSPQGYGVSMVNACQWGRVHNSHFRNCRHATSINNSNTTELGGIGRHLTVESNEVRDTPLLDDAVDTHSGCEYINLIDNDIYDAGNNAINIETNKATVKNNRIYRPGIHGIFLHPCATGAPEYVVEGNEIHDAAQYGTRYFAEPGAGVTTPEVLDIIDNRMVRCALGAAYADPSAEHRLVGARMNDNRAHACGASGTTATFYLAKGDGCEQRGNIATMQPNGTVGARVSDFTDGKWNGNVVAFASAGTVAGVRGATVVRSEIAGNATRAAMGVGGIGLRLDGASSTGCRIHDNEMTDATTPYFAVSGGAGHVLHANKPGAGVDTIASATTITLTSSENDVYLVSGTTTITSLTTSWAGRRVTLVFQGALTFTDGSNLKLNGNLSTAALSTITLVCDGTNWVEQSRSVN